MVHLFWHLLKLPVLRLTLRDRPSTVYSFIRSPNSMTDLSDVAEGSHCRRHRGTLLALVVSDRRHEVNIT